MEDIINFEKWLENEVKKSKEELFKGIGGKRKNNETYKERKERIKKINFSKMGK